MSRAKVPRSFTKGELARLRSSLPNGFSHEQTSRLGDMIGRLNEPSFMTRLEAFAVERQIVLTDEDQSSLQAIRSARNSFVHGRGRTDPNWVSVNHARVWISRFLAEAILGSPMAGSPPLGPLL